jgi:hypothetical protein
MLSRVVSLRRSCKRAASPASPCRLPSVPPGGRGPWAASEAVGEVEEVVEDGRRRWRARCDVRRAWVAVEAKAAVRSTAGGWQLERMKFLPLRWRLPSLRFPPPAASLPAPPFARAASMTVVDELGGRPAGVVEAEGARRARWRQISAGGLHGRPMARGRRGRAPTTSHAAGMGR